VNAFDEQICFNCDHFNRNRHGWCNKKQRYVNPCSCCQEFENE